MPHTPLSRPSSSSALYVGQKPTRTHTHRCVLTSGSCFPPALRRTRARAAGRTSSLAGLANTTSLRALARLGRDQALLALLDHVHAQTLLLRHRHLQVVQVLTDHEDVRGAGGELCAGRVLQVRNVEGAGVALHLHDLADAAAVGAAGHDHGLALAVLDQVHALLLLQVVHDGVTDGGVRVRVADSVAVVRHSNRHAAGGRVQVHHLHQLDLRLRLGHVHQREAALDVVHQAKAVARLRDLDHVHEACGVLAVAARVVVHVHQTLAQDHLTLARVQRVLQAVADDHQQRQALAQLVRTRTRARSKHAGQLAQHPVLGRIQALEVLLGHLCARVCVLLSFWEVDSERGGGERKAGGGDGSEVE
ncbi:40S ribosomal protein S4, putative [Leishmania tarentolae]|uniref:40S ribosomal protein S4, putative n=1 Tax=Leishmania tarentolae TaxID=5689 RepID=A0A640KC41_LEITA|nr:40S ribosomal protein S4, putative [Leishmania tarentolae]